MTLTIELSPEEETRLNAEAAQRGLELSEYVRRVVQEAAPRRLTARELIKDSQRDAGYTLKASIVRDKQGATM